MRVAVDIDGTLSKTFECYGEELAKRGFDVSGGPAQEFVFWETDMLYPNVPADTALRMYEDNWRSMRSSYEVYPGADWIVQLLLEHELVALTNRRVFGDEAVCSVTQEWLDKHGFAVSTLIHTSDKASECVKQGFEVLIEDSPRNAYPVADAGVVVLLHDQVYNRHVEHANVIRFTHWLEVPALLRRVAQRSDRG